MTLSLTAANVKKVFADCLFTDDEASTLHAPMKEPMTNHGVPGIKPVVVEGILNTFGFHPERLAKHKEEIWELLSGLPEQFHADNCGGWSFLQACMTQDGGQWGEHANMEQLLVLGLATQQANYLMPRDMWGMMPGGMPYFSIKQSESVAEIRNTIRPSLICQIKNTY